MSEDPLAEILDLDTDQQVSIERIEARFNEVVEQLFASELSLLQMMKQLKQVTDDKHRDISELLNEQQQLLYLAYLRRAHKHLKQLL